MDEEEVKVCVIHEIKRNENNEIDPIKHLGKCLPISKSELSDICKRYKISELFGLELPPEFRYENKDNHENGYNLKKGNYSLIIREIKINPSELEEMKKEPLDNIMDRADQSLLKEPRDYNRTEESIVNCLRYYAGVLFDKNKHANLIMNSLSSNNNIFKEDNRKNYIKCRFKDPFIEESIRRLGEVAEVFGYMKSRKFAALYNKLKEKHPTISQNN